jgi:hypothetical protein
VPLPRDASYLTDAIEPIGPRKARARRLVFAAAPLVIAAGAFAGWALRPDSAPRTAMIIPDAAPVATVPEPSPIVPPPPQAAPTLPEPTPGPTDTRGTLVVRVLNAKTARIELDDRVLAAASETAQDDVVNGRHTVVVKATGFEPFRASVDVRPGRIVELPVKLVRAASTPRPRPQSTSARKPPGPIQDGIVDPFAPKR